jgi:glycosyltransferase involved in cell wall biosynthesis
MKIRKGAPTKLCLTIVLNPFTNDSRVLRESHTLAKNGFEVTVFSTHDDALPLREQQAFLSLRRFKLTTKPWPRSKLFRLVKYVECVCRMVVAGVKARPTVVHANDLNALPIGYVVARLTGAKLVYDAHELWRDPVLRAAFPDVLDLGVLLERWLARRADGVITVSESIARDMAENIRIAKPVVVRNVPQMRRSAVLGSDEDHPLRRGLGISDEVPLVLYQGLVDSAERRRGLLDLLEAFPWVPPPAVLVFLGGSPNAGMLKRRAVELGVGGRVFFHPLVPPDVLLDYTADATIGVHPIRGRNLNHQYCLPNKLFEYLQVGLPVVVSDLPEMAAVVKRYGVGETFEDGNSRSLAKALNAILEEPEKMKRYAEAAQRAAGELNWEREERKLLEVYEKVLRVAR